MTAVMTESVEQTIAISWLTSKSDSAPRRDDLTWQQLAAALADRRRARCSVADCEHSKCLHKNGRSWSPATFPKGAPRKGVFVESVALLVVDLDHLTDDQLEAARAPLKPYRHILHSSHSDRRDVEGERCIRAVLDLSRPAKREEWPVFWPAAMAELGQPADPSCCDVNRLYFLPSRPRDADYYYVVADGDALDVDAILANAKQTTIGHTSTIASSLTLDDAGTVGAGQRHAMLKSLAGAMRYRGSTLAEIKDALASANKHRCNPPKPDDEIAELAAWAAAQPMSSLPTTNGHRRSDRTPDDRDDANPAIPGGEPDAGTAREAKSSEPDAPEPDKSETPKPRRWHRARSIVAEILERSSEPWVSLSLGGEELVSVRLGGIVLETGGTGSGKTSLAATMLVEHARDVGPAIGMSLELPRDEFVGRMIGIRCNESWRGVLTGRVAREHMEQALPERLVVIERRDASIGLLREAIAAMQAEYPGQPILVAVDYVQICSWSAEGEIRRRVADVMAMLDDVARECRVVLIALSQSSRASSRALKSGEKIGAETTDAGAEAAELERWSTVTIAIGGHSPGGDDSCLVPISVGKSRMGIGDCVHPARYCGRSGLWRHAGEPKPAADVRAEQTKQRDTAKQHAAELAMIAAADKSKEPCTHNDLIRMAQCGKAIGRAAISALIDSGELVEVRKKKPRAQAWQLWRRAKAEAAGIAIIEIGDPCE